VPALSWLVAFRSANGGASLSEQAKTRGATDIDKSIPFFKQIFDVDSTRNVNVEVSVYFVKVKQGYTGRNI
jgi:hypothetical protein